MPSNSRGRGKVRDGGKRSPSRNTTPSSTISASFTAAIPTHSAFLELPLAQLNVPTNITYELILDRYGAHGTIPDPQHLETISSDLKTLVTLAEGRGDVNLKGMRELSDRRNQAISDDQHREREAREQERQMQTKSSLEGQAKLKIETIEREDEELVRVSDLDRRKKDRHKEEDRPPDVGAHRVGRQDGVQTDGQKEKPHSPVTKNGSLSPISSSSPLSEPAIPERSPIADSETALQKPSAASRASSKDSEVGPSGHQPAPAAAQPQYQTFGPNPLTFDDPTVYEVRSLDEDALDEEKREVYCVSIYPQDDLRDLIAGVPPTEDYSHATKPSNQVQTHTFASYLEGYLRPLKGEDIGFLNERGDRVTPFIIPPRGKRHYSEIWAEEDGMLGYNAGMDSLPANQARGSLDEMDDEIAETDQISNGPMLSRLLSTLRFEHRVLPSDEKPFASMEHTDSSLENIKEKESDSFQDGTGTGSFSKLQAPMPAATVPPDGQRAVSNLPNLTHHQIEERLKNELRHIGFLAQDDEPQYDAFLDDQVAERLRYLQDRLRRVSIMNGARKRRLLELAEEQLAYQEYSTILEDLDGQVQQAYLKRARTTSKSKKHAKKPTGNGTANGMLANTSNTLARPAIGDLARQVMDRRARWQDKIGPVFRSDIRRVRRKSEPVFAEREMEPYLRAEQEVFDDEGE